jgi:hypothetical protein
MKTAPCKYCSAPIIWAKTPAGRAMPIDPEPVDMGNVQLLERDSEADAPLAVVTVPALIAEGQRYRSHFVTCPKAAQARKLP